jgi:sigma-B regulation protein RsbU (phosphoserine phosphatase)
VSDSMQAVRQLLDLRYRSRPEDLPPTLAEVAPLLDAVAVVVLLADYEQLGLWPLHGSTGPGESRAINGTLAGDAYRTAQASGEDGRIWLPLLHGAERLGVLEVWLESEPAEGLRRDLGVIAALVAELIASRRFYGDAVELTRRRMPMQLAAEIIWNQLPPLTFAANDALVTAVLEPCYDVGGDAFDYAANGDILHVALFDTVGHGISASALTTLTLNTYRNARRSGLSLADTYRSIDKWIGAQYPGAFVTAVLAELDTGTGAYRRIAAGHPAELHLRGGRALAALPTPTALPLGLGRMLPRAPGITELLLEPGDTLLLYTDGVTEARSVDGELFGLDRLRELVIAELGRGSPAETMRKLVHTIVSYENGELRDDATAALVQWHPGRVTPARR